MTQWGERRRKRRERKAADRARLRWHGPTTAFVLSGGGVLGAVQVGQLRALLEAGIAPDVVVGTSVGSLNGAMIAADPTVSGVEALTDIWDGLRAEDIFPGSRVVRAWNMVARGDHIHSGDGIRRLAERLPARTFEDLALPLHICTARLDDGTERWFDSGPLTRAILASTALPGVFPPVSIDGALYVDGGVVNNVPISKAIEIGARRVYVLTCGSQGSRTRPVKRPIDVMIQSFAHARSVRFALDVERYREEAELIMVPAPETGFIAYNDPSQSKVLMRRAYESTRAFLAEPATKDAT